ncbi:replication initiation protein [Acinetobacter baumannii]|nr:replication initiation protein [Acinetobacter baumannii]
MTDTSSKLILKPVRDHDVVSTLSSMPQASYLLDINLEKLMYCAITIIHKHEMDNKLEFNPRDKVSITADNFYQLLYEDSPEASEKTEEYLTAEEIRLRKTRMQNVRRIMERAYERFTSSPVMLVKVEGSDIPEKVTMIQKLHYEPKTRIFSIQFAEEFFRFFYNLLKHKNNSFNRHELKQIMKMNSYYSLRLYRVLNSELWRTNRLIFSYDELRSMFMKENQYRKHIHFKTRVIEPAIAEINRLTNLEVHHTYIKKSYSIEAVEFKFGYKKKYINSKMSKALEKFKLAYLKKGIAWSDDLSHFKDPDRINHFTPPLSLKPKQIKFLISSPTFMNDYGFFYEGNGFDLKTAQTIMKALLTENLALVNTRKPIDLDYYFALDYKQRAENNEDDVDHDSDDLTDQDDQDDQDE